MLFSQSRRLIVVRLPMMSRVYINNSVLDTGFYPNWWVKPPFAVRRWHVDLVPASNVLEVPTMLLFDHSLHSTTPKAPEYHHPLARYSFRLVYFDPHSASRWSRDSHSNDSHSSKDFGFVYARYIHGGPCSINSIAPRLSKDEEPEVIGGACVSLLPWTHRQVSYSHPTFKILAVGNPPRRQRRLHLS